MEIKESRKFELEFTSESIMEIELGVIYFQSISSKLGSRFEKATRQTLNAIKKSPYLKALRYNKIRVANISGFPYSFHFEVDELNHKIIIAGLYHQHQNPEKWRITN